MTCFLVDFIFKQNNRMRSLLSFSEQPGSRKIPRFPRFPACRFPGKRFKGSQEQGFEKLPTLIDAKRPSHPKVPSSAVSKVPTSYRFQVSNGKVAKLPVPKLQQSLLARCQPCRCKVPKVPHATCPQSFSSTRFQKVLKVPNSKLQRFSSNDLTQTPNSCKAPLKIIQTAANALSRKVAKVPAVRFQQQSAGPIIQVATVPTSQAPKVSSAKV